MSSIFEKSAQNPVVGPGIGICFDVSVLFDDDRFRMWFSWRDQKAIALVESDDGITWSKDPTIVLSRPSRLRRKLFGLRCDDVSRPCVLYHEGKYHLWYSVHADKISIAYARSNDGKTWKTVGKFVLTADQPWEKDSVMCPCVIYDDQERLFKMWYSGGEKHEPDAIGYASSPDGLTWKKHSLNPVMRPDQNSPWEKDRVTAMHVLKQDGHFLGFYIGFAEGYEKSSIGMARSPDGFSCWERHDANPLLTPGDPGEWDDCNVYKPFVIHHKQKWMLWYNASRHSDRMEQIGLATCDSLNFISAEKKANPAQIPCP